MSLFPLMTHAAPDAEGERRRRVQAIPFAVPEVTMSDVRWMAVRCCCTPRKIFGFIQAPLTSTEVNALDERGRQHALKIKLSQEHRAVGGDISATRELAIYSDDHPIEFWRTIPGFVEAA